MDTTYDGLRTHYAQLSDDDLRHIAVTAPALTEDAQRALREELTRRGIGDTAAYKRELDSRTRAHDEYLQQRREKVEKWHRFRLRLTLAVLATLFLFGAWRLIVSGDRTNGIGIMAACALVLPIVLAHAYVRRALLRLMLRK